jgi:hypothetical protein
LVFERGILAAVFFFLLGHRFSEFAAAPQFFDTVLPWRKMDSFPGDYYSYKCRSGKKSSDIFNDYL